MMKRIDELNSAIEANNDLLNQYSVKNISPEFIETFQLQRSRISTVVGIMRNVYAETYREAQEGIMRCLTPIVCEVI